MRVLAVTMCGSLIWSRALSEALAQACARRARGDAAGTAGGRGDACAECGAAHGTLTLRGTRVQSYLLTPEVGAGSRTAGAGLTWPAPLADEALRVWRAGLRSGRPGQVGKLHDEVSRVLWAMGVFNTKEAVTPDGLFCVDVALEGEKACARTPSQVADDDGYFALVTFW